MKPNFLIIGAMKSGTTALHHFLMQHPDIYMPSRKELRFFALENGSPDFRGSGDDHTNRNWVTTWEEYCDFFSEVKNETLIGEASPFYLYSSGTAQRIKTRLPDVKLIVVLREPSSRAFSSFQYLRQLGREPIPDFDAALAAEEQRKRDNWEFLWHYRTAGLYASQVHEYQQTFPNEQIWIGIYDDLMENPLAFVQAIFRFLDVVDTFEPNIKTRHNVSGTPKVAALNRVLNSENVWASLARVVVPRNYRPAVRTFLTLENLQRNTIPARAEQDLKTFYRSDIDRLEGLIGRDLSAWKV